MPRYEVQVPCNRPVKVGRKMRDREIMITIDLNAADPEQAKYFAGRVPQIRTDPTCNIDKAIIIERG